MIGAFERFGTGFWHLGTDCGTGLRLKMCNENNKKGQVGQVGTGFYHNHANVRAIRGIGKMRPNPSRPVPKHAQLIKDKGVR